MKGTKIKVLNEVVYDELKKLEDWEYTLYNW
jgi:GTP-sensing pleiotropic transcriptional regulator CodY